MLTTKQTCGNNCIVVAAGCALWYYTVLSSFALRAWRVINISFNISLTWFEYTTPQPHPLGGTTSLWLGSSNIMDVCSKIFSGCRNKDPTDDGGGGVVRAWDDCDMIFFLLICIL